MSCFIHEDSTYDRLLITLGDLASGCNWYYKVQPLQWVTELRRYNIEAFKERYQGRYLEDLTEEYKPDLTVTALSAIEAFKILSSIDYQCMDSTIYAVSIWREQVETLKLHFAESIITRLPEYTSAAWE